MQRVDEGTIAAVTAGNCSRPTSDYHRSRSTNLQSCRCTPSASRQALLETPRQLPAAATVPEKVIREYTVDHKGLIDKHQTECHSDPKTASSAVKVRCPSSIELILLPCSSITILVPCPGPGLPSHGPLPSASCTRLLVAGVLLPGGVDKPRHPDWSKEAGRRQRTPTGISSSFSRSVYCMYYRQCDSMLKASPGTCRNSSPWSLWQPNRIQGRIVFSKTKQSQPCSTRNQNTSNL